MHHAASEGHELVDVPVLVRSRSPLTSDPADAIIVALIARLDALLRVDKPALHRSLAPGVTQGGIGVIESELGFELPRSLRLLLTWRDGLRAGALGGSIHLDYRLLGAAGIGAAWRAHPELFRPSLVPFAENERGEWLAVQTAREPPHDCGRILRVRLGTTEQDVRFRNLPAFLEVVVSSRGKFASSDDARRAGMRMLAAAREHRPSA